MNTKIIVALVIGIVLIGLTGVVSASLYEGYMSQISTQTEIIGTHFSSSSQMSVSGIPVHSQYIQSFQAEMAIPDYTRDFSDTYWDLTGTDYSTRTSIRSSPGLNTVSTLIANPSDVTGIQMRRNCGLLGQGIGLETAILPQQISAPVASSWEGRHPVGWAYPAYSSESHNIYWP